MIQHMRNRCAPMPPKFEITIFCKALVTNDDYAIFVKRLSQSTNQMIIYGISEIDPMYFDTKIGIKCFISMVM